MGVKNGRFTVLGDRGVDQIGHRTGGRSIKIRSNRDESEEGVWWGRSGGKTSSDANCVRYNMKKEHQGLKMVGYRGIAGRRDSRARQKWRAAMAL